MTMRKPAKQHFKTIVISDVHLGSSGAKSKALVRFLKQYSCETLILNGDIIDAWQLKRYGRWRKRHTRFFKLILRMIEKHKTNVIYLRGNHDDFLDQILPLHIGSLSILRDYVYESHGRRFYVTHGDVFDSITSNLRWLAKLGDIGYTFLLWLNKKYNHYRAKQGLPYYSLSQKIKSKVKTAVNYISDFEEQLAALAKSKGCDGVICGHIHCAAIREIDGVLYMNSGDWVESLTALVEDDRGNWQILHYADEQSIAKEVMQESVEETDELDEVESFYVATWLDKMTAPSNF
ncbi:UDP-2,3-diacylglucosamine pyrophosphatase LpxH [Thermonema lapsum]|uniref:UDP-2,3-diacylglucosamine pyrophosphatase LpxH n=1 Tax=Thermonema lapsum TaxID=28195 RepID=A0A846MNJ3_9BACT|nr:UDP-2,3-diacylglucosamine pyrophosphatase LpxH [Thermonema lapsum]